MNHYLATFEVEVPIKLNDLQQLQANRALNMHYVGREQIPLKDYVPSELREASYTVARGYRKHITVGVKTDGSLEIIND